MVTSKDLQPYTQPAPEQTGAIRRLAEWADAATAAYGVADKLVKTSFVPEVFRGKPYEATAAILAGLEVGLSPMSSLRAFDVIGGMAAPKAITLRAVAQAAGHRITLIESTDEKCVIEAQRAGEKETQRVEWTIERATKLGLANKDQWKKQPKAMLVARATAEAARLVASDALLGLNGGYAAEELDGSPSISVPQQPRVTIEELAQQTASEREKIPLEANKTAEREGKPKRFYREPTTESVDETAWPPPALDDAGEPIQQALDNKDG